MSKTINTDLSLIIVGEPTIITESMAYILARKQDKNISLHVEKYHHIATDEYSGKNITISNLVSTFVKSASAIVSFGDYTQDPMGYHLHGRNEHQPLIIVNHPNCKIPNAIHVVFDKSLPMPFRLVAKKLPNQEHAKPVSLFLKAFNPEPPIPKKRPPFYVTLNQKGNRIGSFSNFNYRSPFLGIKTKVRKIIAN